MDHMTYRANERVGQVLRAEFPKVKAISAVIEGGHIDVSGTGNMSADELAMVIDLLEQLLDRQTDPNVH